ncbi:hypothetical protein VNO78_11173 [Psophocarpus tetragonolobus]|uniref:Uncharacterized protein n=1 Tax=Psophocarpus tetragonolobus TaxID=3891 RepID=A0AAN9SNG2_PSOTE
MDVWSIRVTEASSIVCQISLKLKEIGRDYRMKSKSDTCMSVCVAPLTLSHYHVRVIDGKMVLVGWERGRERNCWGLVDIVSRLGRKVHELNGPDEEGRRSQVAGRNSAELNSTFLQVIPTICTAPLIPDFKRSRRFGWVPDIPIFFAELSCCSS